MKVKPFELDPAQSYIKKVSNVFWDAVMPTCTPSEWMILNLIFRRTVGYQKAKTELSYDDFIEGTSINGRATIAAALKGLIVKNYITQEGKNRGKMLYGLNQSLEFEVKSSSEIELDQAGTEPQSSSEIELDEINLVQKLNYASSEIELDGLQSSSEIELDQSRLNNMYLKDNFKLPNGMGKKPIEAKPIKTGKPETPEDLINAVDRPKKRLMGTFLTETGTVLPKKKSECGFWWSEVGEWLHIVGDDADLGQVLVAKTIRMMRDENLTIGSPKSLTKTLRSIAATHSHDHRREVVSFD